MQQINVNHFSSLVLNTKSINLDYGTFIDPSTTANSYAFGSQQPTVIILGGCPACKVGI